MVPCKDAAKEVSFELSHHRISLKDLKLKTTLHVSIFDSGSERRLSHQFNEMHVKLHVSYR